MKSRSLVRAGMIGGIYALLTVVWPFSIGLLQCRISEALTVLPYFLPEAVPGLFAGCILGNLLSGAAGPDILFGSMATLFAAFLTRLAGRKNLPSFFAPLPVVIVNALVVGALLTIVYEKGLPYPIAVLQVAGGEAVSSYVLGLPLLHILRKKLLPARENTN